MNVMKQDLTFLNTNAYKALKKHVQEIAPLHMRDLFNKDKERGKRFFIDFGGLKLDFSKNRISSKTLDLLVDLANECDLKGAISDMFSAQKINNTENRSVLHIALRNQSQEGIFLDGINVMDGVNSVLSRMANFAKSIRTGSHLGYTNQIITDIVNIGIGGSDLGTLMVCNALRAYGNPNLRMHFVSNVDGSQLSSVLSKVHPETTLFIIASKTFSTQETLTNALTARAWFLNHAGDSAHVARHFVAVSTNKSAVEAFGIDTANMFEFWNWVGGRYSLWSSIGLPIMIYLGEDNFNDLLYGAHLMDNHFRSASFHKNLPVILALLGIWYINFFGAKNHVCAPYDQELSFFAKFLQQLDMESNGKQVDKNGDIVSYDTAPIVWGDTGINAQHAFFQLLHQGTHISPIDLIGSLTKTSNLRNLSGHHDILLANLFAQSEAFMRGKTYDEALAELLDSGLDLDSAKALAPHKVFSGNRPSNVLLLERISPRNIGSLIALYEHKIFVQGVIWNINSFDQFGVELGKVLAKTILSELKGEQNAAHDSSTSHLIELYRQFHGVPNAK